MFLLFAIYLRCVWFAVRGPYFKSIAVTLLFAKQAPQCLDHHRVAIVARSSWRIRPHAAQKATEKAAKVERLLREPRAHAERVKVYPSAHAVVWLLLALLHVMVTPSLEFATAVQALHTALVLPEHFVLAKKPLPHVVHALQVSALPSASTR